MDSTDGDSRGGGGEAVVGVVVRRSSVKKVKTELEAVGQFGKKIGRLPPPPSHTNNKNGDAQAEEEFLIYTTIITTTTASGEDEENEDQQQLHHLRLNNPALQLSPPRQLRLIPVSLAKTPSPATTNPLTTALTTFLSANPPPEPLPLPKRYSVYPPLLLLPASTFASPTWQSYLTTLSPQQLQSLYASLAYSVNCTHLALNAPIPATSTLRSPSNLTPLYPHDHHQQREEFQNLWVSTHQNGLYQTWAPMHTMFSRGNISEKARILNHASYADVKGQEIADLYAGIGYFVFSYLKAGAKRVWCWEINPWSVEALRRGARGNGFRMEEQVVVFEESNAMAVETVEGRSDWLGVTHVNLGLLPSSRGGWGTALRLLKSEGGWVHVHENIGEHEIAGRVPEVVEEFERLDSTRSGRTVECVHVERVKTFAPGVVHCVLDLRIRRI